MTKMTLSELASKVSKAETISEKVAVFSELYTSYGIEMTSEEKEILTEILQETDNEYKDM